MTLSREVMVTPSASPRFMLKRSSFASRRWCTTDVLGSRLTRSAYRITKKMPRPRPTIRMISRESSPSLIEMPANPDAMPVAKGLMVDPRVPIPQPSRRIAAPVSASYPAATITAMTRL